MRMTSGFQAASVVYVDGQITSAAGDQPPQSTQVNVAPLTPGTPVPASVTAADRNAYYVIAGSFLMENRAQSRLNELIAAGYSQAEVVRFPNSTFYSVCAGKFGNRHDAVQLEKKLEQGSNIEAFVRAMQ